LKHDNKGKKRKVQNMSCLRHILNLSGLK